MATAEVDDQMRDQQTTNDDELRSASIPARRFDTAGDAAEELFNGFNDWSASISNYGMQASYSVIAANWAVFGSANAILTNNWAKTSMTIVVTFIALNLFLTLWMTRLYRQRVEYANKDKDRWNSEFEDGESMPSAWPYTSTIESLGTVMRLLKTWAPITAGLAFVLGLLA